MAFKPEEGMPSPQGLNETMENIGKLRAEPSDEDERYKQKLLDAVLRICDAVEYLANREKAREEAKRVHFGPPES